MAEWELACPREPEVMMPILRPRSIAPRAPREARTSSGTHLIQRPPAPAPRGFSEEEVPTGRLGHTQLKNLVERSANPEVTARRNVFTAPTTPLAIPVPAAAVRPPEEVPAVQAAPVVILSAPASEAPEIEILGEVDSAAFPLVVPSGEDAAAARPRGPVRRPPRPLPAAVSLDFARNVLGHGYLARRLLGLALLVAGVASAAWMATGR
jgi:hypothetical protein